MLRIIPQGKYIYERGSRNGKRVQSNMGAKNHGVVMPDANKENTLNQLVGAAFGAAGQRCMALSTAVFVGESAKWLPDLVKRAQQLKVNAGKYFCIYKITKRNCVVFGMEQGCQNLQVRPGYFLLMNKNDELNWAKPGGKFQKDSLN